MLMMNLISREMATRGMEMANRKKARREMARNGYYHDETLFWIFFTEFLWSHVCTVVLKQVCCWYKTYIHIPNPFHLRRCCETQPSRESGEWSPTTLSEQIWLFLLGLEKNLLKEQLKRTEWRTFCWSWMGTRTTNIVSYDAIHCATCLYAI